MALSIHSTDRRCGKRQSFFDGPAKSSDPVRDRLVINAGDVGPVRQKARISVHCQWSIASVVAILLCASGPAAIVSRVGTVVVDAFDGVGRSGSAPHVKVERLKTVAPFIAHDDTASTVSRVGWIRKQIAAGTYAHPDPVLAASAQSVRHATGRRGESRFFHQAPATLRVPIAKILTDYVCFGAAVALTSPSDLVVRSVLCSSEHDQSAKSLAGDVEEVARRVMARRHIGEYGITHRVVGERFDCSVWKGRA